MPATDTLLGMNNGKMQAFSTGDRWPSGIVEDGAGFLPAIIAQIYRSHPEEYLAVRADWVDKYPRPTVALLMGLIEAQMRMNQTERTSFLAQWKCTVLMITHDIDEDLFLADRLVMMANGPAAEIGEIMEDPLYYDLRNQALNFLYSRFAHDDTAD